MDAEPVDHAKDEKGRFLTGNIGGGRPKGARNKLGEAFLKAMQEDFDQHGAVAIEHTRITKPEVYVRVIAGLLPSEHNLNVNRMDDLSDDELRQRIADLATQLAPFLGERPVSNDSGGKDERGAAIAPRVH